MLTTQRASRTTASEPGWRDSVRSTTAGFMQMHVTQPTEIEPAVFKTQKGFLTAEEAGRLDRREADIWAEAFKEAQKLAQLIADCQVKLHKHDPKFHQIDPKRFTLSGLMEAVEDSRGAYEHESIKGSKGLLRKGFRKLGENAESFKQWLKLVPSDPQYTAPIAGAFMIFLSMTNRMHKVREDIFQLMTAVPDDFDTLRDYFSVYEEVTDEKIYAAGANVCKNIFRTLQHAMRFMAENPFKKAFKSLKLDNYESVISTSIEKLQESKAAFRNEVDKCLHSRVGSLFRLAKSSSMLQRMMICEVLKYKDITLDAVQTGNEDIKRELADLRNVVLNSMYNKLLTDQDERNYLADMAAKRVLELQDNRSKRLQQSINVTEILDHLDFDADMPTTDQFTSLSLGSSLSDLDLSRLSWVKKSQALRSWITDSKPASLLFEGNINDHFGSTSPLSFLCAEMAHFFDAIKSTIVLTHYCGLCGQASSTRRSDAVGMTSSLLGQLLQYADEDTLAEARIDKSLCSGMGNADLDSLLAAFQHTVLQLPDSWTVICLIDSIECYESRKKVEDTAKAIKALLSLVKKTKKAGEISFKLLLTATKASRSVGREFRAKDRILVPEAPLSSSILQPILLEGR